MKTVITAKNIGKKYNINHQQGGYIALRDVIANIFQNPFTFLKSKTKEVLGVDTKEEFWALQNINFEIQKGEIIGIIGHNGAGKSTLLKILSQITPPTTGEIKITGRVGSLLEVGTGFHPELTGRENIFLNGAILGMTKKEIVSKFDEIIKFADIEKFLDTPVKYYSSGMYVRLAFSVAAHMDPEILIIDEVLAVGDAEFQKKCLGKMGEITKNENRTILFVSHNIDAVKELCNRSILLEKGQVKAFDDTSKIVNLYLKHGTNNEGTPAVVEFPINTNRDLSFQKIWITNQDNKIINTIPHNESFDINIEFQVNRDISPTEITITAKNSRGINIFSTSLSDENGGKIQSFDSGMYAIKTSIDGNFLIPDIYSIRIYAHERGSRDIDLKENAINVQIVDAGSTVKSYGEASLTWNCVFSNAKWDINKQ